MKICQQESKDKHKSSFTVISEVIFKRNWNQNDSQKFGVYL